jgi:fructokinase
MQIGIDFGGTKIEAAALDRNGQILSRVRMDNPGDYTTAIATVRDLVGRVEREIGARGTIGIGTPGSISPTTGVMRNSNSLYLIGRRFR